MQGEAGGTRRNKNSAISQWQYFTQVLLNWPAVIPRQTRWTVTLKQMGVKSFVQLGVFLSAHGEAEASQGA
jgi:hypothetical protein